MNATPVLELWPHHDKGHSIGKAAFASFRLQDVNAESSDLIFFFLVPTDLGTHHITESFCMFITNVVMCHVAPSLCLKKGTLS